jgi:ketosteroid isomerase-like protein
MLIVTWLCRQVEGGKMTNTMRNNLPAKNIRTVQEVYAAFAKHDIEAILAVLSPDVEWGEPANPFNPSAGTRHGHAGFLEWLQIGRQSEDILVLEPRQFLTDTDTVAIVGYTKCLAKPTGKTYETDFVHLVTFKDGKIVRFREFFDTYAAAEAFRPVAD